MTRDLSGESLSFVSEISNLEFIRKNSPCYIINIVELEKQIKAFQSLFPEQTVFAYSYKTNYLKPIIEYLNLKSFLSEVVSPFEVDITKKYKINPTKIIFNGPTKDYDSINYVLSNNGLIQIDSFQDLKIIEEIVTPIKKARIGIRLNLSSFNKQLYSRFGFDTSCDEFKSLTHRIIKNNNINLESIHTHIASRSLKSFKEQFKALLHIIKNNKNLNNIKFINIGGGFPSILNKFLEKQINPEFSDIIFTQECQTFIDSAKRLSNNQNLKIIVEPGTRIVAPIMSVAGNFYAIKKNLNENIINTNISRTDFGAMNNSLSFPLKHIPSKDLESQPSFPEVFKLCGYTCVEKDILGDYELNNPTTGDLFFIDGIGSYSQVNKSPFIGPELPLLVFDGNKIIKVREGETASDVTSRYINQKC